MQQKLKNPAKNRFSIIIPNYNSKDHIIKLLKSIDRQTYRDFELIIVDDISTDGSWELCKNYALANNFNEYRIIAHQNEHKRFNGGTRNVGVELASGEYIIFVDCDDWFFDNKVFENISKKIDESHADLIRLPYQYLINKSIGTVQLSESTPEALVHSVFVAPWTKCIKRELYKPFPENTLIEDVSQHIEQLDVINTIAVLETPVIVWNRTNENAISADKRIYTRDDKRYSSIYRNIADLIDLKVEHKYCKEERQNRIDWYLDKVHNNLEDTIIKVK